MTDITKTVGKYDADAWWLSPNDNRAYTTKQLMDFYAADRCEAPYDVAISRIALDHAEHHGLVTSAGELRIRIFDDPADRQTFCDSTAQDILDVNREAVDETHLAPLQPLVDAMNEALVHGEAYLNLGAHGITYYHRLDVPATVKP